MTAIILAGGMGTRLQSVVDYVPKPMAPINNRPFLEYLLKYLTLNGITKIILSVGYKGEMIKEYFGDGFQGIPIFYSFETTPLGTGGVIKLALEKYSDDNVFIINGDTFFDIDLRRLSDFHVDQNADITMSLKEIRDSDRYGIVEINDGRVTSMREKEYTAQGYINGGIYCARRDIFDGFALPEKFSFEKFLTDGLSKLKICGFPSSSNFIDIGIPED